MEISFTVLGECAAQGFIMGLRKKGASKQRERRQN